MKIGGIAEIVVVGLATTAVTTGMLGGGAGSMGKEERKGSIFAMGIGENFGKGIILVEREMIYFYFFEMKRERERESRWWCLIFQCKRKEKEHGHEHEHEHEHEQGMDRTIGGKRVYRRMEERKRKI